MYAKVKVMSVEARSKRNRRPGKPAARNLRGDETTKAGCRREGFLDVAGLVATQKLEAAGTRKSARSCSVHLGSAGH